MAGHGQLVHAPDGSFKEIITHDAKHAIADWLANTGMLYGLLAAGVPQKVMNPNDGMATQAAKTAAIFEAIVILKQALARIGIQLPASMYGAGAASVY